MTKKKLGKGLGAIISTSSAPVEEMEKAVATDGTRVIELPLDKIIPNPDQPRTVFLQEEIEGLAESIKSVGLIQPIIVRQKDNAYVIVAGERRYRATKLNDSRTIKAIVIEADEELNFTVALIENIQRENLNPIEEAKAYKMLINGYKLKQADVAKKVGKERATITNSIRLLNLPEKIQDGLADKKISSGHAKVLLSILDSVLQSKLYDEILDKGLSVRALEAIAKEINKTEQGDSGEKSQAQKKSPQIKKMEDELVSKLGTKVEIRHSAGKGRIEISYYSLEDFERIIEMIK